MSGADEVAWRADRPPVVPSIPPTRPRHQGAAIGPLLASRPFARQTAMSVSEAVCGASVNACIEERQVVNHRTPVPKGASFKTRIVMARW